MTGAFSVGKGEALTQFPHDRGGFADQLIGGLWSSRPCK